MSCDPKDVKLNSGCCLSGGHLRLGSTRAPPLPVHINVSKVCLFFLGQWPQLPSLVKPNRQQNVPSSHPAADTGVAPPGPGTLFLMSRAFWLWCHNRFGAGDIWEPSAGGNFTENFRERSMKERPLSRKTVLVAVCFLPPWSSGQWWLSGLLH